MTPIEFAEQALAVCSLNPKHTDLVVLVSQAALGIIDYWTFLFKLEDTINPAGTECLIETLNLGADA